MLWPDWIICAEPLVRAILCVECPVEDGDNRRDGKPYGNIFEGRAFGRAAHGSDESGEYKRHAHEQGDKLKNSKLVHMDRLVHHQSHVIGKINGISGLICQK